LICKSTNVKNNSFDELLLFMISCMIDSALYLLNVWINELIIEVLIFLFSPQQQEIKG